MESSKVSAKEKSEKNKYMLQKIKSDYFLQSLFNILLQKKSFEIIKYNKKAQKRLDIKIDDYKEYCLKYSSIELEIIPVKNKYNEEFINIYGEDKKYYHIF